VNPEMIEKLALIVATRAGAGDNIEKLAKTVFEDFLKATETLKSVAKTLPTAESKGYSNKPF